MLSSWSSLSLPSSVLLVVVLASLPLVARLLPSPRDPHDMARSYEVLVAVLVFAMRSETALPFADSKPNALFAPCAFAHVSQCAAMLARLTWIASQAVLVAVDADDDAVARYAGLWTMLGGSTIPAGDVS